MKNLNFLPKLFLLVCAFSFATGFGQITTKAVKFAPGKSSAVITGSVTGYQTIDYTVSAKENQTLKVDFKSNKTGNFFNVLPPGSQDEAIFVGSNEGNSFGGTLSLTGTYKIRVYLMRNDARKNVKANYTLNVSVR